MLISPYFVWFVFYSFLGWIWESIYCTIVEKKWADRGFLFGPICPIYGFCVIAVQIVVQEFHLISANNTPAWEIFLIGMIGSAIVEYVTSYVLEKRFHARWWDYSNMPLNVNGRICLPASCLFGVAGIAVVKLLLPALSGASSGVPDLAYEILGLLFAGLVGADLALTEASLNSLLKQVEAYKAELNQKAELTYENLAAMPSKIQSNVSATKEKLAESKEKIAESTKVILEESTGKLAESKEKIAESTREYLEESKEKRQESRERRAEAKAERQEEAKEKHLESREKRTEAWEKTAARYVEGMDFFQRRSLNTIKKITPRKGEKLLPEHNKAGEFLKKALTNRKNKNNKAA